MTSETDDDRYLSTAAAARFTGYAKGTLKNWRVERKGPAFSRSQSGTIRYRLGDLRVFVDALSAEA